MTAPVSKEVVVRPGRKQMPSNTPHSYRYKPRGQNALRQIPRQEMSVAICPFFLENYHISSEGH